MSKISFEVSGDIGAPTVAVELTAHDYFFGDGTRTPQQLEFMHTISIEVEAVIHNRLHAMHKAYKRGVQDRQEANERELVRSMEITELENRLADLKGVPMQATAPTEEGQ